MMSDNNNFPEFAIVSTFYSSPGGISTYVKNLHKATLDLGVNNIILSPDVLVQDLSSFVTRVEGNSRLVSVLNLIKLLHKNKINKVQCHCAWYLQLGCLIYAFIQKLCFRKIVVISVKHSDIEIENNLVKVILEFIDNRTRKIVFVSHYLKDKYINSLGYNLKNEISIATPGVSTPKYDTINIDKLKQRFNRDNHDPILSYIGLFEYPGKVKGLLLLIEVLEDIIKIYPRLTLIVAGRGSLGDQVYNKIESLNLDNNIFILEDIDSPYDILSFVDLHCHITYQDSFALTVLESLSVGVQTLASSFGEIPNIKIPGLVVMDNDKELLENKIVSMLKRKVKVDVDLLFEKYCWKKTAQQLYLLLL